jgi:DNA modification methylase
MTKISQKDRDRIIEILSNGSELPLDYKNVLFPPEKKEYELVYEGKEREEDIIADTMAVPLQPIKTFEENGKEWTNKLIFGDNLQAMKALLDDPKVKGKVKLIYIDPPFATKKDFKGSQDQKAYQDKISGAKFIEYLRKRLIFIRELLAKDGTVFTHFDIKKAHYIKVIMDEVFGERMENELIWHYPDNFQGNVNRFPNNHNVIYLYSMSEQTKIKRVKVPLKEERKRDVRVWDKETKSLKAARDEDGNIIYKEFTHKYADDVWSIGQSSTTKKRSSEFIDYPTQKPEELLRRIIECSSEKGEIVLDAFAGSGTTLAVAEKLGRKWIGIDCGKLAIYTIQKRLLNLKKEIGNKGKTLKPKAFTVYNAGLYDFSKLKKLPWKDWRLFALHLFNCRDKKHTVSGVELDGSKGNSDVLVFNYQQQGGVALDYGFIDDLHSMLGSKTSREFFIIAPAASVTFLENYIDKGDIRYYILRIPYSIINELHTREFEAIQQPIDESQVNETVDAVGFDFIRPPKVECDYKKKKDTAIIKINKFKSEAMLKGASQLANRESLSFVMVDFNYGGKEQVFDLDKTIYASEIEKNNWEIHLPLKSIKDKMMVIYLDIYGNEYREIKTKVDFK